MNSKSSTGARKHFQKHFGTFFENYNFFGQKNVKKVSFFDAVFSPTKLFLTGGTIFDWSTIPYSSSRNNSNLTKLCSLGEESFESWPFFAFRIFFASPVGGNCEVFNLRRSRQGLERWEHRFSSRGSVELTPPSPSIRIPL